MEVKYIGWLPHDRLDIDKNDNFSQYSKTQTLLE